MKNVMKDIFHVDAQCPEKLHELYNDLPFLHERKKNRKNRKTCS